MTNEELTRKFFEKDGYVRLSGIEIVKIADDEVTVRAKIKEEHLNANGAVQGGMLYTLADFAFAVLGNHLHPMTVTQGGHIHYLRPAITDEVTATATERIRAGHNTVSDVTIYNGKGETVCVCTFNGFVKDADREELKAKYTKESTKV
ncbi:MAG: hotdog fold thioesterase [Clostridia bacterium]|nr:hotdog fold thioesterase [Clostridia bacterium]